MRSGKMWGLQSFIACFVLNSILLAVFYSLANQILMALGKWVSPFLALGNSGQPADTYLGFMGLSQLIGGAQKYLALVIFGVGLAVTLTLWLVLRYLAGHHLMRSEPEALQDVQVNSQIEDSGVS